MNIINSTAITHKKTEDFNKQLRHTSIYNTLDMIQPNVVKIVKLN